MTSPDEVPLAILLRADVARRDHLDSLGISRGRLQREERAGRLFRPFRGAYAIADLAATSPGLALLRAAHVHLGPESIVVLRSALELHGIAGVVGSYLPELAMPPGLEKCQREGLVIHFWAIRPDDISMVDGLPVTGVLRTLADAVRLLPRMQAVSCLDSALDRRLIGLNDLPLVAHRMLRRRHCVSGRLRLADARVGSQSPLETRVRLRAADGGYPPDALQVPILGPSGDVLGYGDAGYRLPNGGWLVVEADGRSVHELPEAVLHDRRRQNAFVSTANVDVIRFTWPDTINPETVPGVLRPALTRAGWRPRRP